MPKYSRAQPPPREKQINILVKDPLYSKLVEYHDYARLPGRPQDTARDLLALALDQPFLWSKLLKITRMRAWKQTAWGVMGEMRAGFESSAKTFEMVSDELDQAIDQAGTTADPLAPELKP